MMYGPHNHFYNSYDLKKEFLDSNGKSTAMDGELELFQEIVDKVMSDPTTADIKPEEVVKKSLHQIAGKLIAEGLSPGEFTIHKAIDKTRNVAAPVYVKRLIEQFPDYIVKEMKKMYISDKFGL